MTHLPDDLLERFALGEVDIETAVLAAEHLDACPYCSARAAQLEPLHLAFAHATDPEVPEDFVASVLAQVEAPEVASPQPAEIWIGGALLVAAGVLLGFGDWASMAAQVAVGTEVTQAFALALAAAMPSALVLLPLTAATGVLSVLVVARAADAPLQLGRR